MLARVKRAMIPIGANASFRIPLGMGTDQTVDLYVEGFRQNDPNDPVNKLNGSFRRVASGALLNLKFNLAANDPLPVVLYPTETFRCMDSRLTRARAFHTATLLPNGMVFLFGGVVADPADTGAVEVLDGSERLYLTPTAELYDPSTGKFSTVNDMQPNGALARAFHHAALLNLVPPYQILTRPTAA